MSECWRLACRESRRISLSREWRPTSSIKNNYVGSARWRTFRSQVIFSPASAFELMRAVVWMARDTKSFVVRVAYVYWNADNGKWNCNCNELDNWNDGNEVLACYKFVSPLIYFGGVFVSKPFFQPPSIRPISASCSDKSPYLSVGKHLFSQAICAKNFIPSNLAIAKLRRGIFCSGGR